MFLEYKQTIRWCVNTLLLDLLITLKGKIFLDYLNELHLNVNMKNNIKYKYEKNGKIILKYYQ